MRSALICVFFTLVVQRDGSSTASGEHEEDFNPTPIPLSDWPRYRLEPAGTLQEIVKTEELPAAAAVPPHYWEDALRHSVYLTLVRDKIDQLIAKGDYISPNSKPENLVAKDIDDHDLWDKIKTARFDRLKEEPIPPADVTILARGRLLEDEQGYRFIEDDASKNNCSDSHCPKGVIALWSVKRMRQGESSPGKYHYELTFSVTSQTTKKVKKPYENPVRTFTIKETTPTIERQKVVRGRIYQDRPQRAIWVHRNIYPIPSYQKRPPSNTRGLDRIFSSLFSDKESYEDTYRYKPKTYMPNVYLPHAKVAFVEDRESYHQKKLLPHPIPKPQPHRYSHPPILPPPAEYVQHPYFNLDSVGNLPPYVQPYSDNRFLPSNVVKTTRPAVLPTPFTNYPLLKESTIEVPVKTRLNATEYTTKEPDSVTTYKMYQQKQSPMKISYVTDHIRPPVYNAPPGIFVTMDKKPFKPMPPLKYSHLNKPHKAALPDFRPSPQVLDTQFSEQDSLADTAFRPITMNITEISDLKDDDKISKKTIMNVRKPDAAKKPAKKHENIKSTRLTTVTPEIITADSNVMMNRDDDDNELEWANVLGAFTKTTPMASHKEQSTKENIDHITSTTPLSTTTKADFFERLENIADSYEEEILSTSSTTTTTTTTTPKPKKRTRPPPKFNKPEKIKKHKRVTSTTTTTLKPTQPYPLRKQTDDLTPQASSAATSATNSIWETKTYRAPASTTTSSTSPRPTPTIKLTTTSTSSTITTSSPTVETEQPVVTTQPKSKNRFRQSTLMQKGTSVNHDKWSTSTLDKIRTNTATSQVYALRRKASKFTGYIPASTPRSPEVEREREDHRDHAYNFKEESISSSTTEKLDEDILVKILEPTLPTYEEQEIKDEPPSVHDDELEQEEESSETEPEHRETSMDVQESKDDNEYIFPTASVIQEVTEYIGLDDQAATTELTVVASPYSATKNKTKCKKKKHNNLTTEGTFKSSSEPEATDRPKTSSITSTTASPVTPDIFNELFGGFTMDDATEEPAREHPTLAPEQNSSESENHQRYIKIDDDLEDFLHSLEEKSNAHDDKTDEEYDDESDKEGSPFNIHEDSKLFKDDYYEDAEDAQESQDQPFSLLELMDME